MRHLLIDTDTASDDAVALVMALRHPGVRVEAITAVAGNVGVEQAVQNACYTVERCGSRVPVHPGSPAPLTQPLTTAEAVHGHDGLGDIGLPLHGRDPSPVPATAAIAEQAARWAGALWVVTLGPLTNLALALLADPLLATRIAGCVVMGGTGRGPGNVTPTTEFNIGADPEAAAVVFGSGLPLTMVGWDACRQAAMLTDQDADRIRAAGTDLARFCVDVQRQQRSWSMRHGGPPRIALPDPLAMAVALEPAVALEAVPRPVAVDTAWGPSRGQTVVDHDRVTGAHPNCTVVLRADRARLLTMIVEAVGGGAGPAPDGGD